MDIGIDMKETKITYRPPAVSISAFRANEKLVTDTFYCSFGFSLYMKCRSDRRKNISIKAQSIQCIEFITIHNAQWTICIE